MAKSMYEIIKNQNGERFAKAIRNYDNGIFDIPDIDKIVKYAGRDAEPIMNYLVSLKQIKIQEMSVHMDPITLLDRAGYDAYIADTLEKQNAINFNKIHFIFSSATLWLQPHPLLRAPPQAQYPGSGLRTH